MKLRQKPHQRELGPTFPRKKKKAFLGKSWEVRYCYEKNVRLYDSCFRVFGAMCVLFR